MFNGLINIGMLSRGALQLAPIFIVGLLSGNPIWFQVEIVTISTFIAAERSRLAPLGVLLHALVIVLGYLAITSSMETPGVFIVGSMVLAVACIAITAAGTEMRWTGTFTFIPVLYLACATAHDANGRALPQAGVEILPYLLCSVLPVVLVSIASYRLVGKQLAARKWFVVRQVNEAPGRGYFEGMIAAALSVGMAASLVVWHRSHYPEWLIWSAASVVTGDVSTAIAKWKDRTVGAIVGVTIGMAVGMFMPHAPLLFDVLTAAIALTLVAFNRYVVAFGARCALHAIAIIVAGHTVLSADARAIDVVIGSIIGLIFVQGTNLAARSLVGRRTRSR
jgi:hypothetical protein